MCLNQGVMYTDHHCGQAIDHDNAMESAVYLQAGTYRNKSAREWWLCARQLYALAALEVEPGWHIS